MRFMKDTKENFHSEMLLLWVMIMWVWFDIYPETGFRQASGGIIALALIVRHAALYRRGTAAANRERSVAL